MMASVRRMRMISHIFLSLLVSLLMFALVWLSQRSRSHHGPFPSQAARRSLLPRRLKPRSPLDCPSCCLASSPSSGGEPAPAPVRPWREIKSRRGARHPRAERGVCLSQPSLPILWDQRCEHPRGFLAMVCGAKLSGSKGGALRRVGRPSAHVSTRRCIGSKRRLSG